tara:strand:+ start:306 stop:761 length:456 start_codon:yes stop_codon:yes gene_type:complete
MDPMDGIYSLIGEAVRLMSCSRHHQTYTVRDIERYVAAPIVAGRASMFYDEDEDDIAGFITHTFLTQEAEDGFISGKRPLQIEDWMTEPDDGQLWLIDFVAPYGGVDMITRAYRRQLAHRYDNVVKISFIRRKKKCADRIGSVPIRSVRLH